MKPTRTHHKREPGLSKLERGLPRIVLAEDLLPLVSDYLSGFYQNNSNEIETGGMWIGEFSEGEAGPVFRLTGFIGAGPRADCSPESVLFDADYQGRALQWTRLENPRIGNLGCFHVHPDRMDECSEGDWLADVEAVRASDTKALVFTIATCNNAVLDPSSLHCRGFKFDFFVLSEASGFEYEHLRPRMEAAAIVRPPPFLPELVGDFNSTAVHGRHRAWRPKLLSDKKRLVAEVRAMEERYGGRAALRLEGNRLFWEYTVVESGRRFPVQVRYPRRYPFEPPSIFSVLPLPASPHQLPGNELCWTNRSATCEWNPSRDTAATCIHAAHRWFACLLVYLTLGKWPAEADDEIRYSQ